MMANKVWEKIGDFLNSLRCEDIKGMNRVRLEEYRQCEAERRQALEAYQKVLGTLEFEQADIIEEYLDKVQQSASAGEKQAYCQGYVDCIQLLQGLGLLTGSPDISEVIGRL